jgi:hypothetical protein
MNKQRAVELNSRILHLITRWGVSGQLQAPNISLLGKEPAVPINVMWCHFAESSGILCREVYVILTVRVSTEMKQASSLNARLGGLFLHKAPLNVPARKINSCLTNCLIDFVNQSFLTWVQMQQFYCSSCWRCMHIRVLCVSKELFCWVRPHFTTNFYQFCLIYHPSLLVLSLPPMEATARKFSLI